MYELEELRKAASKGSPLPGMDVQESVVFYTLRYCYQAYRKNPTEETKKRLKDFSDNVIAIHYSKQD